MKLLLSCDMEGISGIVNWEQVTPGTDEWKRGRKLMAGDVNAAIDGAFEAGADAVTVSDAHWHARTLELEELDARAHLSSGSPSPFSMLQGIDDRPRYDGVAFIGYHAMAGAKKGVLCHTWSWSDVAAVRARPGRRSQTTLIRPSAGHYGVPV